MVKAILFICIDIVIYLTRITASRARRASHHVTASCSCCLLLRHRPPMQLVSTIETATYAIITYQCGRTEDTGMDCRIANHMSQSMVSSFDEAGCGCHCCRNGNHYAVEEPSGYWLHHGAMAVRVYLSITRLVSSLSAHMAAGI